MTAPLHKWSFLIILVFFTINKSTGQQLSQITVEGEVRTYNYFVPSAWSPSDQLPLLFVLHGLTQTGSGVMEITNFNELAENENFIACYPSGQNNAWNANMNVSVSSANDLAFIESLVSQFTDEYNIDESRIYLAGFSNGGFMGFKMLCESEICFAGLASVSGSMSDSVFNSCMPTSSTSILQIHGTSDLVVPYGGSPTTGISIDALLSYWQNHNGCGLTTYQNDLPNVDLFDFSTAQEITYTNCPNSELRHVKVVGGGHQWPGIDTWNGGVGTINMDFYSPEYIWDFLRDKTCQSNSVHVVNEWKINIYPNPSFGSIQLSSENKLDNVCIYNLCGGFICSMNLGLEPKTISLDKGVYWIHYTHPISRSLIQKKVIIH